jgi:hypothetical protein
VFVRFRERHNDGRRPNHVAVYTVPSRRRWRWRIGHESGVELVPYRLLVALVENQRVDGKIRQTYIADLGSIDGHLLSGFYAALEPANVNAILSYGEHGMEAWYRASVRARVQFWQHLHQTLSRLVNRIDQEQANKIMAAVAARIPTPMATEREFATIGVEG